MDQSERTSRQVGELLGAIEPGAIADPALRALVVLLLNVIEDQQRQIAELRADNQRQRDEINRLKGEQGKPDVKGNTPPPPTDYSSERERCTPRAWSKGRKRDTLRIDREQRLELDRAALPADAVFKGYADVVVQDLVFRSETIQFRKAKWYSPGERTSYLAPLPVGYGGQFGPGLKSFVLALGYGANVSQAPLLALLRDAGVQISAGEVAHLLTQDQQRWEAEVATVAAAALGGSPWQELDDTPTRVDGQNHYCQVLTSPLATIYRTTPGKDRLTVLDVLRSGRPRAFLLNAEAERLLAAVTLSPRTRRGLAQLPREHLLDEATLDGLLAAHLPDLGVQQRKWLREALAVAAYHAERDVPVIRLLLTDDAPQFAGVTEATALCWVHEGRHYKKLLPYLPRHQELLAAFLTRFWAYYHELLAYAAAAAGSPDDPSPGVPPAAAERARLAAAFDPLFATETGYRALDERIALTRAKKARLLQVLEHPEVPLHTNAAERGARRRVRKRDVSFGPRSAAGCQAWDTCMTLAATAAQHGVSFLAYLHDRLTQTARLPSLSTLIEQRARELHLGASWATG